MKKASEAQPNHRLKAMRLMQNWTQADVAEKINTTSLNVSRWERGILVPSLHFRQKLCELFGKSSEELELFRKEESLDHTFHKSKPILVQDAPVPSFADPPYYWYVPYQRNPFFTGRENVLQHLHKVLRKGQTETVAQSYALSGLGGIGKTQTAIEYVYRYASEYDAIFWVEASTRENIVAGFASIADALNLLEKESHDQIRIISVVTRWLHTHKNWLLVFDDVEEPELVKGFLPATGNGMLLLTTQRATLGSIALPIELERMILEDATQFLLQRSRFLERGTCLDQIAPADALVARRIAEIMDGLPLALDQAGAYIDENRCSLAEFLHLFQEHPLHLLGERGSCTDHPHSVVQTVARAFERLQQKSPAAADLVTLCCFLPPDVIPDPVFLEHSSRPLLQPLVPNALQFNVLLKEVLSSSLICRRNETRTLAIHYLVQTVLKGNLDEQMQRQWAGRAIKIVNQALPDCREKCVVISFLNSSFLSSILTTRLV